MDRYMESFVMRDREFKALVRGKRIALVGRAGYLRTLNQGEYIDSFDLVARVHSNPHPSGGMWRDGVTPHFVEHDIIKNIGKRLDIWYAHLSWLEDPDADSTFKSIIPIDKPRAIRIDAPWEIRWSLRPMDIAERDYRIAPSLVGMDTYCAFQRRCNYGVPLPGTIAVADIVAQKQYCGIVFNGSSVLPRRGVPAPDRRLKKGAPSRRSTRFLIHKIAC